MIGLKPIAGMHTHPNGSIPSEQDTKYIKGSECPLEVVISDHGGSDLKWFCFNRNLNHVNLYFNDSELEKSFILITQSLGLTDLGRVMVTPKHELLCETQLGRSFLTVDSDTMSVHMWLEKNKDSWINKTKTKIQSDTGLSLNRVNAALKKLGKENLK
jgi:hypothetical protein